MKKVVITLHGDSNGHNFDDDGPDTDDDVAVGSRDNDDNGEDPFREDKLTSDKPAI